MESRHGEGQTDQQGLHSLPASWKQVFAEKINAFRVNLPLTVCKQ